ncbi:hypothetical protein ACFVAJ_18635 [Agromyces sp. NPDC057679]|uniref:hypothetical protein n=1 Tax=Agromyces sp. NPDC057679 TaxID=3346207 RepID=UPI0036709E7B
MERGLELRIGAATIVVTGALLAVGLTGCSSASDPYAGCVLETVDDDREARVAAARPYLDAYLVKYEAVPDDRFSERFDMSNDEVSAELLGMLECDPEDPYYPPVISAAMFESFQALEAGELVTAPATPQQVGTCPIIPDPDANARDAANALKPGIRDWLAANGHDIVADRDSMGASWYDLYGTDGTVTKQIVFELGCLGVEYSEMLVADAISTVLIDLQQEAYVPVPADGGTGGGGGSVDVPDVDAPDVNPFYCSWSLRGGFNCGVHG